MGIPLSSLPLKLQEKILGRKPTQKRQKPAPGLSTPQCDAANAKPISRSCPCGSMILRPDGIYPEECPGCGRKFADV